MIIKFTFDFNLLAILACGVASLIIGFIWYGPLFGKAWSGYTGWTAEKAKAIPGSRMAATYGLAFLGAIISAVALSILCQAMALSGAVNGLALGLLAGIGFAAMAFATTFLFEHRPLKLWLIVSGYQVVYLAAAGIIIAVWR